MSDPLAPACACGSTDVLDDATVCGPCLDDDSGGAVDLAQRLSRTLAEHGGRIGDERDAYARLAKHYERAGLRGLAAYYRDQASLCPSR